MNAVSEHDVTELVDQISDDLGLTLNPSTIGWINRPDGKESIADSTIAFTVDGKNPKDNLVILVSNSKFPHVVREDAEKARSIAERVDPEVGRHIIRPVSQGYYGARAYSAFSRLTPLSENSVLSFVQKRFVAPKIAKWSAALALQTRQSHSETTDYERCFLEPLTAICRDKDQSPEFRRFAEICQHKLSQTERNLFTCVEHGDFWVGNVLFERKTPPQLGPIHGDFFVIDWRGSSDNGYPCADIIRFCASIYRQGSNQSHALLQLYRETIGIDRFEMGLYSALSLAKLGANLDKFPRERYYLLCQKAFNYLNSDGYLSTSHPSKADFS